MLGMENNQSVATLIPATSKPTPAPLRTSSLDDILSLPRELMSVTNFGKRKLKNLLFKQVLNPTYFAAEDEDTVVSSFGIELLAHNIL